MLPRPAAKPLRRLTNWRFPQRGTRVSDRRGDADPDAGGPDAKARPSPLRWAGVAMPTATSRAPRSPAPVPRPDRQARCTGVSPSPFWSRRVYRSVARSILALRRRRSAARSDCPASPASTARRSRANVSPLASSTSSPSAVRSWSIWPSRAASHARSDRTSIGEKRSAGKCGSARRASRREPAARAHRSQARQTIGSSGRRLRQAPSQVADSDNCPRNKAKFARASQTRSSSGASSAARSILGWIRSTITTALSICHRLRRSPA